MVTCVAVKVARSVSLVSWLLLLAFLWVYLAVCSVNICTPRKPESSTMFFDLSAAELSVAKKQTTGVDTPPEKVSKVANWLGFVDSELKF